ncbi:MADS-box transcription factor Mbx1 [Schizosaccharomyces japonicus yFS275]|uniref:MADS-box transcription factor Mbx1 n=1 Tax=Schizosaccharomyces japonicus (strain yFS275 / FY16936) TaxID=402676 RepID=B6K1V8_SCHJY|nr:MADS-box transcription factor Mbx1 [Schizosaccharomyces japonicus yFS275]EEB07139.1 MADS-box transcription factor Mbx1 [Schizosaccharomyces japonicus yFS275]
MSSGTAYHRTIQRIPEKRAQSVTFNRRKTGLFKKAHELSVLCDAQIAIVVFDPKQICHVYSSEPTEEKCDALLRRYLEKDFVSQDPLRNQRPPDGSENESWRPKRNNVAIVNTYHASTKPKKVAAGGSFSDTADQAAFSIEHETSYHISKQDNRHASQSTACAGDSPPAVLTPTLSSGAGANGGQMVSGSRGPACPAGEFMTPAASESFYERRFDGGAPSRNTPYYNNGMYLTHSRSFSGPEDAFSPVSCMQSQATFEKPAASRLPYTPTVPMARQQPLQPTTSSNTNQMVYPMSPPKTTFRSSDVRTAAYPPSAISSPSRPLGRSNSLHSPRSNYRQINPLMSPHKPHPPVAERRQLPALDVNVYPFVSSDGSDYSSLSQASSATGMHSRHYSLNYFDVNQTDAALAALPDFQVSPTPCETNTAPSSPDPLPTSSTNPVCSERGDWLAMDTTYVDLGAGEKAALPSLPATSPTKVDANFFPPGEESPVLRSNDDYFSTARTSPNLKLWEFS